MIFVATHLVIMDGYIEYGKCISIFILSCI